MAKKTQKKKPKIKKTSFTLFQWLDEVSYYKRPWKSFTSEQQESFNPFMVHRFISMNKNYIDIVNEIQKYNIPSEQVYNFYKDALPKHKQFFRYVVNKSSKIDKDVIYCLCKLYDVGKKDAIEYIKFLTEEQKEELKQQILQK